MLWHNTVFAWMQDDPTCEDDPSSLSSVSVKISVHVCVNFVCSYKVTTIF